MGCRYLSVRKTLKVNPPFKSFGHHTVVIVNCNLKIRNLVMKYLPEFAMRSLRLHVWNYDVDKALRKFD